MVQVVEFDFETKIERSIPLAEVRASCEKGRFCWIDFDAQADPQGAQEMLRGLGVEEHAINEALGPDVDGRHDIYDDYIHTAVTSSDIGPDGKLSTSHVDIIIAERYVVTLRRGQVNFIELVRRQYRQDFIKFARTPGFLLYEFWDSLLGFHKKTLRAFGVKVERLADQVLAEEGASDAIFNDVSAVTRDLLSFRKIILAAREVLHELSNRKSPFISESTQPFLEKMVDTLERLNSDLTVDRDILAETLNLYMGVVSHRTNRVVSRLTVISVVFLPLTFLCGVYGMNFPQTDISLPELQWEYGYITFWIFSIVTTTSLLWFMKKRRWW